ncbi:hypothetical protein Tco_1037603 [Tanacetum coccineum]
MINAGWIEAMQDELLQFKRLDVWKLVTYPENTKPLTLKWLFKTSSMKKTWSSETTLVWNKCTYVNLKALHALKQAPRAWMSGHLQEYFRSNAILRRKVNELVLEKTRLNSTVNCEGEICVSIRLICSSPLDKNIVNGLWLSL